MAKSSKAVSSPSITEQMTELSELVEQLEDSEIELETALVLYEKGVKLSGSIQKILESAEQRVAQVAADGPRLDGEEASDEAGARYGTLRLAELP